MTQCNMPTHVEPTQCLMPDFGLTLRLVTEGEFLPLGIADHDGKLVNDRIRFKIDVTGAGIDEWQFWMGAALFRRRAA